MKRFLATGLAAAMAMTAFAAFPTGASADDWANEHYGNFYPNDYPHHYRHYPKNYHKKYNNNGYYYAPPPQQGYYYYPQPYYQYDPGPAIVAGVLGTFLGAVVHSQRHHKVYRKKRY
jgi:hypothetical protein